jgi:D-tyrosyl-tRNA(Tyr) deacylase
VVVDEVVPAAIDAGLLVYLGVGRGDEEADRRYVVEKIARLRVFPDEGGKMNLAVADSGGAVLVVPAFTVQADARKGRRPAFDGAADPQAARAHFEQLCDALVDIGLTVGRGVFGAQMSVEAVNDGPICILLDSRRGF